tara:strand:+ start:64 stop:642 length:579 start_codon:yes stop_codon:yes gene_type:complete
MSFLIKKKTDVIKTIKLRNLKELKKNNKKIAKTRRQRGYQWENTLVKRFNSVEGWKAFRLGSPSVSLPDVLIVSDKFLTIFAIEAKSGTGTTLYVPYDQIERCLNWANNFHLYKTRKVVLAFKFLSKKRIDVNKYESRKLREFYKIWDDNKKAIDCVCTYDGDMYTLKDGIRKKLHLKNLHTPFKANYQIIS